jgi:hypothetical protein
MDSSLNYPETIYAMDTATIPDDKPLDSVPYQHDNIDYPRFIEKLKLYQTRKQYLHSVIEDAKREIELLTKKSRIIYRVIDPKSRFTITEDIERHTDNDIEVITMGDISIIEYI